jgi:hypothetical protein
VRRIGVLIGTALVVALCRDVAFAGGLTFTQSPPNFAAQLMLRLFGETADSTASFSAESGDRSSESPLRELALRVNAPESNAAFAQDPSPAALIRQHIALADLTGVGASYLARAVDAGLLSTDVRFAPSAQSPDLHSGYLPTQSALYTAAYQPVPPVPDISPGPGTIAFDGGSAPSPPSVAKDTSLSLGAPGRATKRGLSLSLSGQFDRTLPNALSADSASLDTPQSWQLPAADASLSVPNYAGTNRLSLGAGLAVPVFHGLTLNLNYDAVRTYGGFTLPGLMDLDSANNLYAGRLTYQIPYSSSSLSISAYQNRYGESVLPINGYTQTGEDVNFTVKF